MTELQGGPPGPPQSPQPPPVAWSTPPGAQADGRRGAPTRSAAIVILAASLVPAAFAVLLAVLAPAFYEPLVDGKIALLGLSPGVWFLLVLVAIPAVNLLVARVVGHPVVVGVSLAVTVSLGLFVVILAPAVVLIAENLGT